MPTAAKLMAGICFAILGFVAAAAYAPGLPDGFRIGDFLPLTAVLGFFVGWFVMGPAVGVDLVGAAGRGLSTMVWFLFWALIAYSLHEMILRALDKRYRHPMDALTGAIEIGYFFFKIALTIEVMGILIIGGMISGVVAEMANRRWR